MAKKRSKIEVDYSQHSDLFAKTELRESEDVARPKRVTPKSRLRARVTYDIGQELKEAIRGESVRLGIPASQVAKYLLLFAWDDYVNGRIPAPALLPSNSPAYRNVIDFSE